MVLSDSFEGTSTADLTGQDVDTVYTLENFTGVTLSLTFLTEGALNVVSGENVDAALVAGGVSDLNLEVLAAGTLDVSALTGEGPAPSDVTLTAANVAYTLKIADGQDVSVSDYEGPALTLTAMDVASVNGLTVENVATALVLDNGTGDFEQVAIDVVGENELSVVGQSAQLLVQGIDGSASLFLTTFSSNSIDASGFVGGLTLFNMSGIGLDFTAGQGDDWIVGGSGVADVLTFGGTFDGESGESFLNGSDVIKDGYSGDNDQLFANNISGLGVGSPGDGDLNISGIETILFSVNEVRTGTDAFVDAGGIEGAFNINVEGTGQLELDDLREDVNLTAEDMEGGGSITVTGSSGEGSSFTGSSNGDTIAMDENSGWDSIDGRDGNDQLAGGSGNDDFFFTTALDSEGNVDTILDFTTGEDQLQLDLGIFSVFSFTGNPLPAENVLLFDFEGLVPNGTTDGGQDANDYLLYDTSTGSLYYDASANGAGPDPVLFAVLQSGGFGAASLTPDNGVIFVFNPVQAGKGGGKRGGPAPRFVSTTRPRA